MDPSWLSQCLLQDVRSRAENPSLVKLSNTVGLPDDTMALYPQKQTNKQTTTSLHPGSAVSLSLTL